MSQCHDERSEASRWFYVLLWKDSHLCAVSALRAETAHQQKSSTALPKAKTLTA
jgi:hypothetical protein